MAGIPHRIHHTSRCFERESHGAVCSSWLVLFELPNRYPRRVLGVKLLITSLKIGRDDKDLRPITQLEPWHEVSCQSAESRNRAIQLLVEEGLDILGLF